MSMPSNHQITQLLRAWNAGDDQALDQLMLIVYDELHRLAQAYMGRDRVTALTHHLENRC
jgi:hypothetical protein